MSWESEILALLSASLVRPFALVVAAGLILRIVRVRHPASRHMVWAAVLAGMLLLPFVSVMAPRWKLLPVVHRVERSSTGGPSIFTAMQKQLVRGGR